MRNQDNYCMPSLVSVRIILSLLLFCLPAGLLGGVTGKIAGKVTSAETGEPLPGANVVIVGTSQGAATDIEGDYFVINIRPGSYSVSVSMMGYKTVIIQDVKVIVDHTVNLDFELTTAILEGSEVVVTADREVVIMDRSASEISISSDDINSVPAVRDIQDYLNLEAGIEDDMIRGGGLDQTALMIDGMAVIDNRSNEPLMMLNLSSVEHINIIKGGFNAEYGNIRSGLINVTTKEGSSSGYSGSIDIQLDPAQQKHGGYSLYDPNNYYIRPFLDSPINLIGTKMEESRGGEKWKVWGVAGSLKKK
ncbi:MAG: carboxypeptidase-like regulatory domain-containing protein, partial [FCB group bacterium]|nr:carboxypeptidase-like regulatory domain-containing protein [FCB group bacterium]